MWAFLESFNLLFGWFDLCVILTQLLVLPNDLISDLRTNKHCVSSKQVLKVSSRIKLFEGAPHQIFKCQLHDVLDAHHLAQFGKQGFVTTLIAPIWFIDDVRPYLRDLWYDVLEKLDFLNLFCAHDRSPYCLNNLIELLFRYLVWFEILLDLRKINLLLLSFENQFDDFVEAESVWLDVACFFYLSELVDQLFVVYFWVVHQVFLNLLNDKVRGFFTAKLEKNTLRLSVLIEKMCYFIGAFIFIIFHRSRRVLFAASFLDNTFLVLRFIVNLWELLSHSFWSVWLVVRACLLLLYLKDLLNVRPQITRTALYLHRMTAVRAFVCLYFQLAHPLDRVHFWAKCCVTSILSELASNSLASGFTWCSRWSLTLGVSLLGTITLSFGRWYYTT